MKHYIDITLIPNHEIPLYFIWQKLYQQIHLALVEQQDDSGKVAIGVSFPEYLCDDDMKKYQLGHKLRLFAQTSTELEALNLEKWLNRLSDYVHFTGIKPVPKSVTDYANFYRLNRRKSNHEKALMTSKRLKIPYEQVMEKLKGRLEDQPSEPYIRMTSLSSKAKLCNENNQFRLIIGKKMKDKPYSDKVARFNSYGLSKTFTVPWF